MIDSGTGIAIGTLCTVVGAIIGILTFWFARKKAVKDEANATSKDHEAVVSKLTSIATDLTWTRSAVSEIKSTLAAQSKEQSEIKVEIGKIDTRLSAVEAKVRELNIRRTTHANHPNSKT